MTRTEQRRRAVSRIVALGFVLTVGAGAAMLVPVTSGSTSQAASPATTVTSTVKAWKWDPSNPKAGGDFYADPRSVTVSQTSNLVSQIVHVSWQNFSASSNPNSVGPGNYPVHVYECDRAVPDDPGDCFGDLAFGDKHPGYGLIGNQTNLVQTFTTSNGSGSADLDVLTGADNPALACSPTHQCSLVVVPWAGGKPASGRVPADCDDHSLDLKYKRGNGFWALPNGSALNRGCDWASRIVVPLSFAPTPLNCPSRDADLSTEGSPMMRRAIDQWRTGVCNGGSGRAPLQVQYTGLSEYQARSDFSRGAVDLGFTSQPASGTEITRKFSYAPIGVTSLAIAYYIDDPLTGKQITDLKLSPRLVAKMLTQSYTDGLSSDCSNSGSYACAPEVAGNPASIFDDPEFLKLNPQYTRADFPFTTQGNSSANVVFGLSDNTYQITQWLAADKGAAAFLNGAKDPWGMHVNTAYLPSVSPKYPISAFSANDPGHTLTIKDCGTLEPIGTYSCLVGGLQNNWFPINGLDNVAKTLVSGKNTAKLYAPVCDGNNLPIRGVCNTYVSAPSEALGTRGLFAVVPGGDEGAYQFPTAALETSSDLSTTSTDPKFVSLNSTSVAAGLAAMKTNADGTTQSYDYSKPIDPAAYPLTTVSYAMAPTCGLSAAKAKSVAAFLDYVASPTANTSGVQPGQLAPGYLPMTTAMRTATNTVAGKVADEAATCPTGSTTSSGGTTTSGSTQQSGSGGTSGAGVVNNGGNGGGVVNNGGNGGGVVNNGGNGGPGTNSTSSGAASSSAGTSPSASVSPQPSASAAALHLPSDSAGAPAYFLPVVLCIGAGLMLAGPLMLVVGKRGIHLPGRRS